MSCINVHTHTHISKRKEFTHISQLETYCNNIHIFFFSQNYLEEYDMCKYLIYYLYIFNYILIIAHLFSLTGNPWFFCSTAAFNNRVILLRKWFTTSVIVSIAISDELSNPIWANKVITVCLNRFRTVCGVKWWMVEQSLNLFLNWHNTLINVLHNYIN